MIGRENQFHNSHRIPRNATHLDGSLQSLNLDSGGLQETILLHVNNLAGLAIDTKVVLSVCMLGL